VLFGGTLARRAAIRNGRRAAKTAHRLVSLLQNGIGWALPQTDPA
jgi:hypothetical protein